MTEYIQGTSTVAGGPGKGFREEMGGVMAGDQVRGEGKKSQSGAVVFGTRVRQSAPS